MKTPGFPRKSLVVYLLLALLSAVPAAALNLIGDADNDGDVDMIDAGLALQRHLGLIDEFSISPLALADGDGDLDLTDALLIGQAAGGNRVLSTDDSGLDIPAPAAIATKTSGDPDFPLTWTVSTLRTGVAEMVDGLEGDVSAEPVTIESTHTPGTVTVTAGSAATQVTPINTTGATELHGFRLSIQLHASDGSAPIADINRLAQFDIDPSVCGNGITQPGEECDDGNDGNQNNDCLDGCVAPICGDGIVWDQGTGTEQCDDAGESATCNPDCTDSVCGDGYTNAAAGETCDLGENGDTFEELGEYFPAGYSVVDMAVRGDRAYALVGAGSSHGVFVADISADTPVHLGQAYFYHGPVTADGDVFLDGDRAYFALHVNGFQVVDISTIPPTQIGAASTVGYARGVHAIADRAYVAASDGGLRIYNVSGASPVEVGAYDTSGSAYGVEVVGTTAYVADGPGGLVVLDVSTDAPALVGSLSTGGFAHEVAIDGDRAYLADGDGVRILDISVMPPVVLDFYDTPDTAYDIAFQGSRVYVAAGTPGMHVFDIQGDALRLVGTNINFYSESIRKVAVQGARAYTAVPDALRMYVVDVAETCGLDCGAAACGDEVPQIGETCDDGVGGSAYCNGDCTLSVCGDAQINPLSGEACDDGNTVDDCACLADCSLPDCGDGVTCAPEICDDGTNNGAGDTYCLADCSAVQQCGDLVTNGTETCDDGPGGACFDDCTALNICGDGVVFNGEVCDDGNTLDCDGCAADCSRVDAACGDAIAECGEACDDGMETATCDGNCTLVACGDGYVNVVAGETCDLGPNGDTLEQIGSYFPGGYDPIDIVVRNNRGYILLSASAGVQVLDVTGNNPVNIGSNWDSGDITNGGLHLDGNRLYVAMEGNGIRVLDIGALPPTTLGSAVVDSGGFGERDAFDIYAVGNRAYVAAGNPASLTVFDVSGATPVQVGRYNSGDIGYGVVVQNDKAYLANRAGGFKVLDVSTDTPTLITENTSVGWAFDVAVSGDRAYLASHDGVRILDISVEPPVVLDHLGVSGYANGIALQGDRVYVAVDYPSLYLMGIEGDSLRTIGTYSSPSPWFYDGANVFPQGNRAFVANTTDFLHVIDISETCGADCGTAACGDGVVNIGEQCDDGGETATCNADCTLTACGDGIVNATAGETCDDGDAFADCACTADCQIAGCGDGLTCAPEACDDGPNNGAGNGWCLADCSAVQQCGDGVINGTEFCDDDASNGVVVSCTGYQFLYGGHQYCLYDSPLDFNAAEAACQGEGGHLIAVGDDAENQAAWDEIVAAIGVGDVWHGYNDQAVEGTFEWTNGEPVAYENWYPGEPSNGLGIEDCGEFWAVSADGRWNDADCATAYPYICEFPQGNCNATCDDYICGDGIVNGSEICDQGAANSDTVPNSCLTDCSAYTCQDIPTANLAAYFPLDESTGALTAPNRVGAPDGTLLGDPTHWEPSLGRVNGAYRFDGVADAISVPHTPDFDFLDQFTIHFWVYPERDGSGTFYQSVISRRNTSNQGTFTFYSNSSGDLLIWLGSSALGWQYIGSVALPNLTWSHVAVTYDGAEAAVLLNGQRLLTFPLTGNLNNLTEPILVGSDAFDTPNWFQGSIDEVFIYREALSDAEIRQYYLAGATGYCQNAVCGDGLVDPGETCDDYGTSATCDGDCTSVACSDGYINVMAGEGCDYILGDNDPTYLGYLSVSGFPILDAAVQGDRIFVQVNEQAAIGVGDTALPTGNLLSFDYMPHPNITEGGVFLNGDRGYFAQGAAGLRVMDISGSIFEIGLAATLANAHDVHATDTRAYVAIGTGGLQVFDITNPTPVSVGSYDTPGTAYDVFLLGQTAYVADGSAGLQMLDVTTDTPALLTGIDTPGTAWRVVVSGDRAFVADGTAGLQAIDITQVPPVIVGSYDTPGDARDVFADGDRVYVADRSSGLHIFDVSNQTPVLIATYVSALGNDIGCVQVVGNRAYVCNSNGATFRPIETLELAETCGPDCATPACGDGVINAGETCDDGNTYSNDGCSPTCTQGCFLQTWEAGADGWTHQVTGGTSPDLWHLSMLDAYRGLTSWYLGQEPADNYDTGHVHNTLTSPAFILGSGDDLTFWERYEVEAGYDISSIYLTDADSGITLGTIRSDAPSATTAGLFEQRTYDLAAFAWQRAQLNFQFDTTDNINNATLGWLIDHLSVGDCATTLCGNWFVESPELCDAGTMPESIGGNCDPTCSCYSPYTGLTAWWDLNNDAVDHIDGWWLLGNGNTTFPVAGPLGNHMTFNNNSAAAVALFWPLTGLTDFTVEYWYASDDIDGAMFSAGDADGVGGVSDNELLLYKRNHNQIDVYLKNIVYAMTTTASLGGLSWHHLALTRQGDQLALYLDGNLESTATVTTAALGLDADGSDGAIVLAQEQDCIGGCFDPGQAYAPSSFDELSIYSRALSATEIAALFQRGTTTPAGYRCTPVCGNGLLEVGETCDDGAANGTGPGNCLADCSGIE